MTFVGQEQLPKWRARFTQSFHEYCLKTTPQIQRKTEIQSLVCGSSLRNSSERDSWKNLGLIHILVVSGGHLSVLASALGFLGRAIPGRLRSFVTPTIASILILFSLANRLQPPVLRALMEWLFRPQLQRRGWRGPEIALMSTWFALPFCSSVYDLLSLALSFFATVTVERTARSLHRTPWLSAVALQLAVWWVLLPLIFTLGTPHPLTTMTNIVLAPLLGALLIPLAMLTWVSGLFPPLSGYTKDPIGLGVVFDRGWEYLATLIAWMAHVLPGAAPRIASPGGARNPLFIGSTLSYAFIGAVFAATCALLIRSRRERRHEALRKARWKAGLATGMIAAGLIAAIVVHRQL